VIPESEWKFFEGTEQRIKHLSRHHEENALALLRGDPPSWDPEELAARQVGILQEMEYPARVEAALGLDPTPEEARHLDLHRRWALRTLFDTHPDLMPLAHELRMEVAAFRPTIGNQEARPSDLARILREAPDRDLREAAWMARAELGDRLEERLAELIQRRELLSREVADTGFPTLAFHLGEQERPQVVGLLDEFERFTRKAYEGSRGELARELRVHALEPWDMEYGLKRLQGLSDDLFPAGEARGAAEEQARRWGIPPAGSITFEEIELPVPSLVGTLEIPRELVVATRPSSGHAAWLAMFEAFGQAVHFSHVQSRRHFLEQESPAPVRASGLLFQSVLRDKSWMTRHTKADPEAIHQHLRVDRLRRIHELRRDAALTAFENLVYTRSDLEPHRLYCDVMEHMLQDTRRPGAMWASHHSVIDAPLSRFTGVIGSMIAAQIRAHLQDTLSGLLEREEVGAWMHEQLFAPGAAIPWPEKVELATGSPLGIDALAGELRVSFDGSTLEEDEEIADETVAEYFKDIDLNDLE
jgi:hypothetical protein